MLIESMVGVAGIAVLGLGVHVSPYPFKLQQIRNLQKTCSENRWVALTYDDGPGLHLTPIILDLLAKQGVKATFFLLGCRVTEGREIVDRIFEEGHEIASHSQIHQNAWKTMPWTSYKDVSQGYQTLEKWMPENGLFRPPHGKLSISSWAALRRRKAKVGWWTIDSGDTYRRPPDSMAAAETLKKRGGGVVLLHDFDRTRNERRDFVIQATNSLLKTIEEEGLSPKKLGDILATGYNRT